MTYTPHFDPALTPGHSELLLDTLAYILNGYRPYRGQTRIEHAELLTLTAGMDERYRHLVERSQVWVEL